MILISFHHVTQERELKKRPRRSNSLPYFSCWRTLCYGTEPGGFSIDNPLEQPSGTKEATGDRPLALDVY